MHESDFIPVVVFDDDPQPLPPHTMAAARPPGRPRPDPSSHPGMNLVDVEHAWAYWNSLGSINGCDIRSGIDVVRAFRAAALQSSAGVVAFATAYRQLFDKSGERPRALDAELKKIAASALSSLGPEDREVVEWLLRSGNSQ